MRLPLTFFATARWLLAVIATLGISACQSLPNQGPMSAEIIEGSVNSDYVLIPVDARVSNMLSRYGRRGFDPRTFPTSTLPPSNKIGVGDVLFIRILEAGNGGLFSQGPIGSSGNTEFPTIIVDLNGNISLPYVGEIQAAGFSPLDIQNLIVKKLKGKAIEPQAVVVVKRSANNSITMAGDVFKPGKYPLSLRGDRLSDAISLSGGSKFPAHATTVTVIRKGQKGSMGLNDVLENPRNNISLQRDDLVVLTRDPKRYTITGGIPRPGTFPFSSSHVSVLEAIAGSGGLSDQRADPNGVFVLRYEKKWILGKLGKATKGKYPRAARGIPTIYQFDFQSPKTQFFAQSFLLENHDAIYVSNAETVQLRKLLTFLNLSIEPLQRAKAATQ